jgi:hypothetical protein
VPESCSIPLSAPASGVLLSHAASVPPLEEAPDDPEEEPLELDPELELLEPLDDPEELPLDEPLEEPETPLLEPDASSEGCASTPPSWSWQLQGAVTSLGASVGPSSPESGPVTPMGPPASSGNSTSWLPAEPQATASAASTAKALNLIVFILNLQKPE